MESTSSCYFAESYRKDGQHGNNGDNKYNNSDDVISRQFSSCGFTRQLIFD